MSGWSLYTGSDEEWDRQLSSMESWSYFHRSEWSSHLKNMGWSVARWHYQDSGNEALLQGFFKRYCCGITIFWFPDWIIGDYAFSERVEQDIRKTLKIRFLYIRIRSHRLLNLKDIDNMQIFKRPIKALNSGLTMHLNLQLSETELRQNLTKNWRHNLNRSNKLDYRICDIKDTEVIIELYSELASTKNIKDLFTPCEIRSLMEIYGDKIVVIGAVTPDGVVQAIRGAIIVSDRAIDIFAAASLFSRKHYLSYSLCWEILLRSKAQGCEVYNFNGVDPENNPGVYNFKKGTGAKLVEMLGEFEWSNIPLMRVLVRLMNRR